MSVSTVAHLNFTGNAREALHFYHSVFGGQVMIATYAQAGVPQDSPDADQAVFNPVDPDSSDADHVAFGMVAADNGFRLAAYDVFGGTEGGVADSRASGGAGRRASGLTHTESFFLLLNGETSTNSRHQVIGARMPPICWSVQRIGDGRRTSGVNDDDKTRGRPDAGA